MKRLLNLYTIIGFILVMNLVSGLAILRFGNCQWNKFIYIYQCYYFPSHPNFWYSSDGTKGILNYGIDQPKNYSGNWTMWHKNGLKNYEGEYLNGKMIGIHFWWGDKGIWEDKRFYKNGEQYKLIKTNKKTGKITVSNLNSNLK